MCNYYYLHYHHLLPCIRDIEYTLQYEFCENSTVIYSVPSPTSHMTSANSNASNNFNQNFSYSTQNPSSARQSSSGQASSSSMTSRAPQEPEIEYVQQPCAALTYAPEYNLADGSMVDYANPCAAGGCLISPGCTSGTCRLQDLGGRWVCCQCCRGGNTFRWCAHPMKKVPDTMCYHVVCENCWADS
ncbi:hypothetical protein AB5N19_03820 [Seiridium cardinale]